MQLEFEVVLDEHSDDVRYTCHSCGVTEHGGAVGNPGLLHRMAAHGRDGHEFPRDQQYRGTVFDRSETAYRIILESTDQSTQSGSKPGSESPRDQQWMPRRQLYREFIVDTNCVNSRGRMAAMNRLETWSEQGVIRLLTSEVAQNEMLAGDDPLRIDKAYTFMFTMSEATTSREDQSLLELEAILFPARADSQNKKNDVEIVFNAAKYMRPLITNDGGSKSQPGGILGNRARLAQRGITVLTPEEAVGLIKREIAARDTAARKMSALMGQAVPEWVGGD